jgi:redox-sensitive bicupin YhaK (pirin superfamily)
MYERMHIQKINRRQQDSHGNEGLLQSGGVQWMTAGRGLIHSEMPADFNALVCVYRGSLDIGGTTVNVKKMVVLRNDPPNHPSSDGVALTVPATQSEPTRAILIAGRPLREPIAQYGPFVMNTREQLMQAVEDFNRGQLA